MSLKPLKRTPVLIALGVIVLVCLIRLVEFKFLESIECMTYDMRARQALNFPHPVATNLGFVYLDDHSIRSLQNRLLGKPYGLYWPRHIYGRLIDELSVQGAQVIAFDIVFGELRPDHNPVRMADDTIIDSDEFFVLQMQRYTNTILASTTDAIPPSWFLTNAYALGDISTEKDSDGVLRRVKAFRYYRNWHWAFKQVESDPDLAIDLNQARVEPHRIILFGDTNRFEVPLDADGCFDLADFGGENIPAGIPRKARPFTDEKAWHMGVILAAESLHLDLQTAEVDLEHRRIRLKGPNGVERTLPVDGKGYFYIDWCMPPSHARLIKEPIQSLLSKNMLRLQGTTNNLNEQWKGKLAIVGSSALGNDLTDRGATPLKEDSLLVSKHWNVANSIITGTFVRRAPLWVDLALIIALGVIAAFLTWQLRALVAFGSVVLVALLYVIVATALYVKTRYWIPIVLPLMGGWFAMHLLLLAFRVVFENAERRRIRSLFSELVSPKIVKVLEESDNPPALGGVRREISVLFADVRGFTQFTDSSQERVAEFVKQNNLTGEAAEACFDEQARETLGTINLYLGLVADIILKRDGLLDKYIGDCVMAFWGAPTPQKHAVMCVHTAIEAQRAVDALNQQRAFENKKREAENASRIAAGLSPKAALPLLVLGTGINSGMATIGMMGSRLKQKGYTAFGREVNLASRLESASGRGRIFIGEATYQELLRDDPALAATCVELPATELKGFRAAVKVYEVPWKTPHLAVMEQEQAASESTVPRS